MISRRGVLAFLALAPAATWAQPARGLHRIGVLATTAFFLPRFAAFREGMRDLGYVEGKNISYEYRNADGKLDRLPALATELVSLKVDLIFTASAEGILAAKKATRTIPIVFGAVQDPVAAGIVKSLARPDGNATGLSAIAPDLGRKRLELLKETVPELVRVAYFWSPLNPGAHVGLQEMQTAAQALGLQILSLEVRGAKDLDSAFQAAKRERAQALTTAPDPLINVERARIVGFAASNQLPAIYAAPEFMEGGGLMSYAPNYAHMWRRAATFADRILRGVKPADLPIEQPTKFELTVNLKIASSIGIKIPHSILVRADRVIE